MSKVIKQEEPVEYYLLSTISDDQLNVALDAYTPQANQLEENFPVQVKQEMIEQIQPVVCSDNVDYEPDEPLEYVNRESDDRDDGTSDYEPDSDKDIENGTDEDYDVGGSKKRKSSKAVPQKDNYNKQPNVSIVEYEDITSIPSKEPPYACNGDEIFRSRCFVECNIMACHSLQIAHRSIHRGKKFQCDVWKHVFKSKSHVYEHMKSHQETTFTCPVCLKSFALKKSFVIHEEKQFECNICKKRFRQKDHVYEHMKTHCERIKRFHCSEP